VQLDQYADAGSGLDLAIDSTGLRLARPPGVGGAGWGKLHVAADPDSGRVLAEELTRSDVHDTVRGPRRPHGMETHDRLQPAQRGGVDLLSPGTGARARAALT
jgi:hypothetical protein